MAGGYGVHFFGVWHLPDRIGKQPTLATVAQWAHGASAVLLVLGLVGHGWIGIGHHARHRDRYLQRMLPFTHHK
jgi:cytochrome b561